MQERKCRFADRTIEFWQPRKAGALTGEDARQIVENVTGFFRVLMEWDAADRRAVGTTGPTAVPVSILGGRRPQ